MALFSKKEEVAPYEAITDGGFGVVNYTTLISYK
jgi:hypothetical protein